MKTEKQKMLDGELYHASDPVLCHDRLKARKITNEFNHSNEIDDNKRTKLIKEPVWINRGNDPHRTVVSL